MMETQKRQLHPVMLKRGYCNSILSECTRLFVRSAVGNTKNEPLAHSSPSMRTEHLVVVLKELLQQCRIWMNERIALFETPSSTIGMSDLYRFVSTSFLSHSTGLCLSRTISLLAELGLMASPLERMPYIGRNIRYHSATGCTKSEQNDWLAQRDQTHSVSQFESAVFRMAQKNSNGHLNLCDA